MLTKCCQYRKDTSASTARLNLVVDPKLVGVKETLIKNTDTKEFQTI